jgi:hypothetical protein
MKQPLNTRQNASSDKTKIILVIIFLAILLLAFGILVGLLLRQKGFQFSLPAAQTQAVPNVFVPTADCGPPTLVLGTTTFQIQNLTRAPDGSLAVPSDTSGVAYWVEGTDSNYMFVLSPTPENLALMQTVTVESTAKATWANCNSTTYSLSVPQAGSLNVSALPDQSIDGITVFFQTDSSGAGFVFKGELTEEVINVISIPSPSGGSEIQANIGLLETTTSADGTTISIGVSIQNYGAAAFTLSASDISLTPQDGAPLIMVSSEPALPKKISAGSIETIYFTFPRPTSQIATLKIFTVEYDIEGY